MKSYRKSFGYINESLCADYLEKNGYSIIHKNFRWKHLEIDIIAIDPQKNCLCFVEVKSRKSDTFTHYPAVSKKQLLRIMSYGDCYRTIHFPNLHCRMDIMIVVNDMRTFSIEHIKNISL